VRRRWQALISLPPAILLCGMSMLTLALPTIVSPLYALAALMGTIGLIWALLGVGPGQRLVVITLLGIGVFAVVWRLAPPAIYSLRAGSLPKIVGPGAVVELLLSAWLVIGPLAVGLFQIFRLTREALRSRRTSLERTHGE
jgi:hypothetical protein